MCFADGKHDMGSHPILKTGLRNCLQTFRNIYVFFFQIDTTHLIKNKMNLIRFIFSFHIFLFIFS